ncbi:hypothetical protein B0T24DRAFT_506525, partial [Lasiosphaeria ovina]
FAGDEFSNNLFSDLAPLLTLFGEQVTKQFLSMSMGWADNVLLAMGPLGIMTVIVSAIRVGGIKRLKAIVGRARESRSTAEQELLSSTSQDVCELWSGEEIVRLIGNPQGMKCLIVTNEARVYDLKSAIEHKLFRSDMVPPEVTATLTNAAPNLALNVKNANAPGWELWLWAFFGVALQLIAIAIPGVATYHWQWPKAGASVAAYGYPCFAIGTVLVIGGVLGCGHVIEGITTEHVFQPEHRGRKAGMQVLVLQRACTVSDQHFSSYAIFNSPENRTIRT